MFRIQLGIFIGCCLLVLVACGERGERQLTPDGAKQFLKLRGYDFEEQAFLAAVTAGDVMAVNAFLTAGINANAHDAAEGDTALMTAAATGNLPMINALLKGGADVNARNRNGVAPLGRALSYNHEEVAQVLLAQPNVDLKVTGANGASILIVYVFRDREDVVSNLLQRGVEVDLHDLDGDTALHGAVKTGNNNVLRMLLAKGANVNIRNKFGATPLMWAGGYGQEQAAQMLLEHSADPHLKDEDGRDAADWADQNRHAELGRILRAVKK